MSKQDFLVLVWTPIGPGPIYEFLKAPFDFYWDLEYQIRRTEEFEKERNEKKK